MEGGIICNFPQIFFKATVLLSWNWCVSNIYGCHIILWFYLFPHKYVISIMQQKYLRKIHSASVLFSLKLNTNGTYLYVIQISILQFATRMKTNYWIHTHIFLKRKKDFIPFQGRLQTKYWDHIYWQGEKIYVGSSWFFGATIKVCRNST